MSLPRLPGWVPARGDLVGPAPRLALDTGGVVPVVYGRARLPPRLFVAAKSGADLALGMVWAYGPLNATPALVTRNGDAISDSIDVLHEPGDVSQPPHPYLVALLDNYTDTLVVTTGGVTRPIAYSIVTLPPSEPIDVYGVIEGHPLYDPRTSTTAWTQNPALWLLDWLSDPVYGEGRTVNWLESIPAVDACAALVGGHPRRWGGLAIDSSAAARQWRETLRGYAGCMLRESDAGLVLVPNRPASPNRTIGASQITGPIALQRIRRDQRPTVVRVRYTDPATWALREVVAYGAGVQAGTKPWRESTLQLPGIQSLAVAYREAEERVLTAERSALRVEWTTTDEGLQDEIGDVVTLDHPDLPAPRAVRILGADPDSPGRWKVTAHEYTDTFSDATAPPDPEQVLPPQPELPPDWRNVPPTLTNIRVTAAFRAIHVQWQYLNLWPGSTQVWISPTSDFAAATLDADPRGLEHMIVDLGIDQTIWIWLRPVSATGVVGNLTPTNGIAAATLNSTDSFEAAENVLSESMLTPTLRDRIALIDQPGTGLVSNMEFVRQVAYIRDTDNLVFDGNFSKTHADGLGTYWVPSGSGDWTLADDGVSGKTLLRYVAASGATTLWQTLPGAGDPLHLVPARQGDVLFVSLRATRNVAKAVAVMIDEYSQAGVSLASHFVNLAAPPGNWERVQGEVELTQPTTAWVRIGLHVNTGAPAPTAAIDAFFSDVRVSRSEPYEAIIETRAEVDGALAQYTVKIDQNGYVSGFGLASTDPVDDNPFSEFAIIADQFTIAPVEADSNATAPFYHLTSSKTVDGVTVPPGTYIRTAWIANGTITTAKIAEVIESTNFGEEEGWQIRKNGSFILRQGEISESVTIGARTAALVNADLDSAAARGRMGDNLSFEAGDTGWVKGVGFVIVSNALAAHAGSWLLAREASGTAVTSNAVRVPVVPGERLTVGGHIRRDSAHTFSDMGWRISWRDSSNNEVAVTTAYLQSLPDTNWHFVTADGVAPATVVTAVLEAVVVNQSGTGGALLWDDGYIERATVASSQIAGFRYAGSPIGQTLIDGHKIAADTAFIGTAFVNGNAITFTAVTDQVGSVDIRDGAAHVIMTSPSTTIDNGANSVLVSMSLRLWNKSGAGRATAHVIEVAINGGSWAAWDQSNIPVSAGQEVTHGRTRAYPVAGGTTSVQFRVKSNLAASVGAEFAVFESTMTKLILKR